MMSGQTPNNSPGITIPDWLHILPAGKFQGMDGRGPYVLANPSAVIAASMAAGKLVLDENNSTDLAKSSGVASPAMGWIDRMEARSDGIWGHVDWTKGGAAMMADRAYRGINPVVQHTSAGLITRVLRASLTNSPNFSGLASLHHQGGSAHAQARKPIHGLTADDYAVCQKMGIDPVSMATYKSDLAESAASHVSGGTDDSLSLTDAERTVCRKMNLDPAKFAAMKAMK